MDCIASTVAVAAVPSSVAVESSVAVDSSMAKSALPLVDFSMTAIVSIPTSSSVFVTSFLATHSSMATSSSVVLKSVDFKYLCLPSIHSAVFTVATVLVAIPSSQVIHECIAVLLFALPSILFLISII